MITFFLERFIIQDPSNLKMIGKGDKVQDLYVFTIANKADSFKESLPISINAVLVQIWHNRLGHLSPKRLAVLRHVLHFYEIYCNHNNPCYVCPLAKHRRLPFISNNHLSKLPFDLVHCDIWGPFQSSGRFGHRFFLTLVDDCTRFTWVFLLKHKSDIIPRFFNMVLTQFNSKIKVFRLYNAKELESGDFFADNGVLHQFSYVARP